MFSGRISCVTMKNDISGLTKSIANLYRCNDTMGQNVTYVLKELLRLPLPDELRNEIETAFKKLGSALYDTRKEIRNLENNLGLHPGEEPFDEAIANPDPQVTMGLIRRWVDDQAVNLDKLVRKLWALSAQESNKYVLVNALVTESVRNILEAQSDARRELDRLGLKR
jgi:hypothetical protein